MRRRASGLVVLALALASAAVGCARDTQPALISVVEMVQREAEVGDELELRGEGFPEGRPAHVRFRGVLRRPGEAPEEREIEAMGTAATAKTVLVAFDEDLQARFCGGGGRARHTAFAGEVEVAFSPVLAGAAPIAGILGAASLDVRPPASPRGLEGPRSQGQRTLAALGLRTRADASGVVVESVVPGSAAFTASIVPGDRLVEWAGVRVASEADSLLPPGAASVRVSTRRELSAVEETREIATAGVAPAPAPDLAGAVLVLALALGAVLGLAAPRPGFWTRLEVRVARMRRPRLSWVEVGGLALVAALPALARGFAHVDLDVLPALLATGAAYVGASALSGARGDAGRSWRLVAGARAATSLVPAMVALASATYVAGALRLGDAIRAQGAWPASWEAVRTPPAFVLLALALAPFAVRSEEPASPGHAALERAFATWIASLLAAVLLGGWALPGAGAEGAFEVVLGAAVHATKTFALVVPVVLVRAALPAVASLRIVRLVWARVVPASLACAAASIALVRLVPPEHGRAVTAAGVGLAAMALASVWRIARLRRTGPRTLAPSAL